ncbi:Flp family type IVb pilin [bacterium]|nr:Flp family type IVb pilin [bacterium]
MAVKTGEDRVNRQRGQGVVEYGLIIGLIAIIVIAVIVALGPQIKEIWSPDSAAPPPPAPVSSDTQP